jgi:hypothetical protein
MAQLQDNARTDNNHRQLAVVVPIAAPAPPVVPVKIPQAAHAVSFSSSVPQQTDKGSTSSHKHIKATQGSILGTPSELSPELKRAVEHGAVVVGGLQKVAARRFQDFAAWMSTLWRQLNESPRITPNSSPNLSEPPTGPIHCVAPAKSDADLYMTTDGRLRTVIQR